MICRSMYAKIIEVARAKGVVYGEYLSGFEITIATEPQRRDPIDRSIERRSGFPCRGSTGAWIDGSLQLFVDIDDCDRRQRLCVARARR